jgi:hypothetical protein
MARQYAKLVCGLCCYAAIALSGCHRSTAPPMSPFGTAPAVNPAAPPPALIPLGPTADATRVPPPPTGSTQVSSGFPAPPASATAAATQNPSTLYPSGLPSQTFAPSTGAYPSTLTPNPPSTTLPATPTANPANVNTAIPASGPTVPPISPISTRPTNGSLPATDLTSSYNPMAPATGVPNNYPAQQAGWNNPNPTFYPIPPNSQPAPYQAGPYQAGPYQAGPVQPAGAIAAPNSQWPQSPPTMPSGFQPVPTTAPSLFPPQSSIVPPVQPTGIAPAQTVTNPTSPPAVTLPPPVIPSLPPPGTTATLPTLPPTATAPSQPTVSASNQNSLLWRNPATVR